VVENPQIVAYLNRLSSLLFIAARFVEAELGLIPLKAKTTAP
jgi:cob(I)alamin adenosyltransferase